MKHRILLTVFGFAFLAFVLTSSSGGRASAANSGNTGAPGETATCTSCHSGGNFNTSVAIQLFNQGTTTAVTTYVPGTTYDMKVTVNAGSGSPAGYGFQMVALKTSNNSSTGTWTSTGSNTKIGTVGSRSYVEHGVGNTYSASNNFTTKWIAPAAGTGNVTFYSAGVAVNGNGNDGGDLGASSNLSITEFVASVSAGVATNVALADVGNNGNGTDLQVSFTPPANQSTVGQYRVMIVKQANAASFNLAAAQAVAAGSYTSITPNGSSTYSQTLSILSKDVNGATITNGQPYVAFVLSKSNGTTSNVDVLSTGSSMLTLQGVAGMATGLVASDIGTPGAPDMQVVFNKATTEATVSAYRIMLVNNAAAAVFNLTLAQAVTSGNYSSITPMGSATYTATFGATSKDVLGNALVNGTTYVAFVLSIADGTVAITNTLSSGSNALQLQTIASVATNVTALDTNETATGEDLLAYFEAATDETTLSQYRIMVVKSANAGSFNLAAANAVTATKYTAVAATGSANYSTTLSNTATDVDGAAIAVDVPYKVFVLSVANGTTAGTSTLSTPSGEITLNNPVNTAFQQNLVVNVTMVGEQLYLNVDGKYLHEDLQLAIFDANGRLVKNVKINQTENWIDMTMVSRGIYWVTIRSGNQLWKRSILK